MALKKGYKDLVAAAEAEIETISIDEALKLHGSDEVVFIDLRDVRELGHSAPDTIKLWASVGRGEKQWIFPFQENADVMFNSALVYELSALKPLAEPLLRQISYGTPEHIEGKRLLSLLEWFLPLDARQVPHDSLLREFIGGSTLADFRLWKNHRED